jgi:hypothetical protein
MILIKGLRDNKDVGRDTKNKRRGSFDKEGHRNIAMERWRERSTCSGSSKEQIV